MLQKRPIFDGMFYLEIFFFSFLVISEAAAASESRLSTGQTVYVPIYSHIYGGNQKDPFDLAATLSIRNTDHTFPITIISVDYYDSNGKLRKRYLKEPAHLNVMASTRFIVWESDKSGGSGANFIVKWKSEHRVNSPIIESVMIGTKMQQGISFVSRGQVIHE